MITVKRERRGGEKKEEKGRKGKETREKQRRKRKEEGREESLLQNQSWEVFF